MNLLLFEPHELTEGGEVELPADDRRVRHLRDVLRAEVGQSVRAGAIGGATGRAEILALGDRARLRVILECEPAPPPLVELVLAVPRPKAVTRVLEIAASFGVRRIDLVNAWRVERSYLGSPRLHEAELGAALRRGCEQGATTWLPAIAVHPLLMPFLDGARWSAAHHRVIAHPRASAAIESAVPPGARAPVVVAIGPEGGWIDRELDTFARLGFTAVHLGSAVLRVEAAVAALLAQLQLLERLPG